MGRETEAGGPALQPNIGVFGGTFNPVHTGHLVMAQDALERFELDTVLFVPSRRPPHKDADELAPARHRVAMLDLAVAEDPRFEVSPVEIERDGLSYTVDTVQLLRRQNPGSDLSFIIGSDTLPELHSWKDIRRLLDLCEVVTVARPRFDLESMSHEELRLDPELSARLLTRVAVGHRVDISSSDIRMRIAEGMSIRYLVPPGVEMYITEHKLYRMGET
jgi:nicotinate-nucleotide adenylyltransferase